MPVPPAVALVVVAIAIGSVGCRDERIAIVPTAIRESAEVNSAKLKDVALGDVVRTFKNGRDPVGVLRAESGFVDEKNVAKRPLVIEKRFVAEFGAALWRDPARTQRARELVVGAPLEVLSTDPLDDVDVVAHEGKPVAFVSRDAIMTTAPTRASLWSRVEARLREQDLEATKRALEAMLVLAPNDEVAREMLSVFLAGTDWERSRALSAGIATPLPYTDAGLTRADAPGPAYVLASVLRVRHEPSEKAAAVRKLPIGTAVIIEELRKDGWARIHIRDDRSQSCMATNTTELVEVPTDVAAGLASGYALAKYLTPTAATLEVVEARRKDAEGRGMFDEATLWAQRANELAPSHERRGALIEAALGAMRWTVAASALLPTGIERPSGIAEVDLAFAWGCRGDPRRAVLVEPERADDGALPTLRDIEGADACTTLNITRPCPLCWFPAEGMNADWTPQDRAAEKEEQARIDKLVSAYDALLRDAETKFPDGPYLRFRSRPTTWPVAQNPWLAIVRFDVSVVAQEDDVLVSVSPIPVPLAAAASEGRVVDVWLPVPAEESLRFHVLFADSEADARAKLAPVTEEGADPRGVNAAHVAASWSRAADGCDCGC